MAEQYSRHIKLDKVINFRDIGGYAAHDSKTVAWRRVFRSGELSKMSPRDHTYLRKEIALNSVVDLRSKIEIEKQGTGALPETDIKYHNIAFITDGGDPDFNRRVYKEISNMGEFYVLFARKKEFGGKLVEALEIIAEPDNHPLVFNCAVGKDRTGILAAILLSVLGVDDSDIIEDYSLSGAYMEIILKKIQEHPKKPEEAEELPDFFWTATPESMEVFLTTLKEEYGSIEEYLYTHGAKPALIENLRQGLLV